MNQGGQSLVTNNQLVNKVYCPREVFPLASMAVAAVDTLLATLVLGLLFVITGFMPKPTSVWVPVLLVVQVTFTFGVTLVMSAVLVFLRDLRHVLPIILQLGLFATPVAYGMDVVAPQFQVLYSALNPLAPVIDGYRRTILLGLPPDWHLLGARGRHLGAAAGLRVRRLQAPRAGVRRLCLTGRSRPPGSGSGSGPTASASCCATSSTGMKRRLSGRSNAYGYRWALRDVGIVGGAGRVDRAHRAQRLGQVDHAASSWPRSCTPTPGGCPSAGGSAP